MTPTPRRLWLSRILIFIVFFFNVQCAVAFLLDAPAYAPSFELAGAAGEGMVRGLGLLFLMWNVPYAVALWHPARHKLSLLEAAVMQAIGFSGETILQLTYSAGHPVLSASIGRFMIFDGLGLVCLLLAAWLVSQRAAPGA